MKLSDLMKSKKEVTVGYIGGSITEQEGWRDTVTAHLREAFPDNEITEINAGMGGTNSFLGVCRMERDLICHKPDIAFIEFSVNDSGNDDREYHEFFGRTYEGMIRKLLKSNPDILVVGVGLTTSSMNENFYSKGITAYTAEYHKKSCDYYNVPFSNAGEKLYCHIEKNGGNMLDFTREGVHTNANGGKFYGDSIWEDIKDFDFNIDYKAEPLYENNFENATFYIPENVPDGWNKGVWKREDKQENHLYSFTPGSEIKLQFYGSAFGIYCTTEKTSGNILWSIDGGEWKERSTWDKYAMSFDRRHYYTLEDNLELGNHSAVIRVSDKKDGLSEGYYLRIIAFLVEKP